MADSLLAGTITSASGEKMGGVTVSAKAEGSPITTSVYTDEAGGYYFPPLAGRQIPRLGAGADLPDRQGQCRAHQDDASRTSSCEPMTNQEDWVRQLPGDEFLAALPGDTPEDFG